MTDLWHEYARVRSGSIGPTLPTMTRSPTLIAVTSLKPGCSPNCERVRCVNCVAMLPSGLSWQGRRVEALEFNASIFGCELPIDV